MPKRAPDFRYVFCNVLGFQFSDNDCRLLFGIDEGEGIETAMEQVGVAMTHKTAKLLAQTLSEIVAGFEAKSGSTIPLDDSKIQGLRDALSKATVETSTE